MPENRLSPLAEQVPGPIFPGGSPVGELVGIPMYPSGGLDVYSGVARASGRLWASRHRSATGQSGTAVVIVHPSSNFLGHYLLPHLAERGVDAFGLCTRYIGNDTALLLENCVLDVAAAVSHLRADGYERIWLVGNSGGGGLVALYQSQAERPTITHTPAGDPPDLTRFDLPPVDGIIELMAHPGRSVVCSEWLDPAVHDEGAPFDRLPELDMFDNRHPLPFDEDFIERYRTAQIARNRRITRWVRDQLEDLEARTNGTVHDLPFVVHGTVADLRFLDRSIDPSDRAGITPWGPAWEANYAPVSLGHHTTLRSWLSQWSLDDSHGDGPCQLAFVTVPVLILYGTADDVCFPGHARSLYDAVPHADKQLTAISGATHYYLGQTDLMREAAEHITSWTAEHARTGT